VVVWQGSTSSSGHSAPSSSSTGLVKYGGADGRRALIEGGNPSLLDSDFEKRREDALRSLGYQLVRLTWRDLHDPAVVEGLIRQAFART
jgi:hypothetical protein